MQVTKIDRTGGAPGTFVLKINVVAADLADNSETDTGADLDASVFVEDFYAVVNTADTATTKTLDVGLLSSESGGNADGFGDGVATGSTGIVNTTLVNGSVTRGVLLAVVAGGAGVNAREPHASDSVTAKSISITHGDASGATALDVDLYFVCRSAVIAG